MKLWLIYMSADRDDWFYGAYDSAVVAAEDEDAARHTHPGGDGCVFGHDQDAWVGDPSQVLCRYIGEAAEGVEKGVVCASFNAG